MAKKSKKGKVEVKGNGINVVWNNTKFRFKITVIRDAVNMSGDQTTCPMWGCKTEKEMGHPVCHECHKKHKYSLKRAVKLAREAWARENVSVELINVAMDAVLATEGSNIELAQAFQVYVKGVTKKDISIETAFAAVCAAKEKDRRIKADEEKRGAFRQIKSAAREYLDANGDEGGDIEEEAARIAKIIAPKHGEHFAVRAIAYELENYREFQGIIDLAESHVGDGWCEYNPVKLADQVISEYDLKHSHGMVTAACAEFIAVHKKRQKNKQVKKVESMARNMGSRGNTQLRDELEAALAANAMDKAVGTAKHSKSKKRKTA